jgi:hypothetical protein
VGTYTRVELAVVLLWLRVDSGQLLKKCRGRVQSRPNPFFFCLPFAVFLQVHIPLDTQSTTETSNTSPSPCLPYHITTKMQFKAFVLLAILAVVEAAPLYVDLITHYVQVLTVLILA